MIKPLIKIAKLKFSRLNKDLASWAPLPTYVAARPARKTRRTRTDLMIRSGWANGTATTMRSILWWMRKWRLPGAIVSRTM